MHDFVGNLWQWISLATNQSCDLQDSVHAGSAKLCEFVSIILLFPMCPANGWNPLLDWKRTILETETYWKSKKHKKKKNMGSIAQHIGSGNVWDTESQKIFVYLCPSCDPCLELPELGQGRETLIGVVAGDWLVLKIISELARGPHGLIYVMYCHVIQYQSTLIMHFAAHGGIITQY